MLAHNRHPFALPSVDPGAITSLELSELIMPQGVDFYQQLLLGETFRLHADSPDIRRFEDKHRNTFFDAIRIAPGDPDVRAVWEPARLQHAAMLLLCTGENGTEQKSGKEAVFRWIAANPFLRGPHYMSAMECGLRVPVFFYCLKKVSGLSTEERNALLKAIYEHAWWVERNLSLYASLGNHTVCECLGLIFAGAVFRNDRAGQKWLETGCRLLDQELKHQILPDGGPAEQSFSYHRFVLDLYWLAAGFLEKNHLNGCTQWKERLLKGEAFLSSFQDECGAFPFIGDNDDGYAVAPGASPERGRIGVLPGKVTTFTESGYTVIRGAGGLLFTFDHGPLGMAPLYNHGHADALSITLSVSGKPILVDSGTFHYNGVPEWRRYFKGTRSHNTVVVDGLDQAVQKTGFIWDQPYTAGQKQMMAVDDDLFIMARHEGYMRLKQSVRHERTVLFTKEGTILVKDTFEGSGLHVFELNFHLHPDARVSQENAKVCIQNGGFRIFMELLDGLRFSIVCGRQNPIHGWFSPAYGIKAPTDVLTCTRKGRPSEITFLTAIYLENAGDVVQLKEKVNHYAQQTLHS